MAGPTGELVIQRKGSTVGWGLYHAIGFYAMRTTRLSVCKYLRHHKNATSARGRTSRLSQTKSGYGYTVTPKEARCSKSKVAVTVAVPVDTSAASPGACRGSEGS